MSRRSQTPWRLVKGSPERPRLRLEFCPALSALGHAALNNATPQWKTAPPGSAADKRRHPGGRLWGWHRYLWELKFLASARPCHREQDLIRGGCGEWKEQKKHFFGFSFWKIIVATRGRRCAGLEGEGTDRRGQSHGLGDCVVLGKAQLASRSASLGSGQICTCLAGVRGCEQPHASCVDGCLCPAGAQRAGAPDSIIAVTPCLGRHPALERPDDRAGTSQMLYLCGPIHPLP